MKKLKCLIVAAATAFIAQHASAYTVEIRNLPPTAEVGQQFSLEYWVSNLGPDEYISGYNAWISWGGGTIKEVPNSLVFGTSLNGGGQMNSRQENHGIGEFSETSYLSPATLSSLQGDSFMLVKYTFDALATGFNGIALGVNWISGSPGLALEGRVVGQIDLIDASVTPVPEPETYTMMLAGLGMLGFVTRRRKQKAIA